MLEDSAAPRDGVLDFSNAYLGDDKCVDIVAAARRHATTPIQLDLRGNRFEAAGAKVLADLLRSQHSVVSICLEWNNVGLLDEGVAALASALEVDTRLVELDLRNNNVGPEGAKALAAALRRNRTLRKLDLRWNDIGNAGALAFVETLQSNHALVTLEITGNNSSLKHADEIERLLARNRSIQGQSQPVNEEKERNERPSSPTEGAPQNDQLLVQILSEKEALETDLEIAKRHNAKLSERVAECEQQLQLLRKELESTKQDRDRYQQREVDAKTAAHDARLRVDELENRRRVEFEEYRTARAALEREAAVLRDTLSHSEALHQKSDDQKTQQLTQLEALKYTLESDVHRLELSARSQQDELQKLQKQLADAAIEYERKRQSQEAGHRAEVASLQRQAELTEKALRSQIECATEQLEDAKRSLATVTTKHDDLQTLVVHERVAHEKHVHELTRQFETEAQARLDKAVASVTAHVDEIKKSRLFLEKEVEKHLATIVTLRQENLSLQQANDARLQSLQQELDRQYTELQQSLDRVREAQQETTKANDKNQQLQRRIEELDKNTVRLKDGYDARLRELTASADAAASHHRSVLEAKLEAIAKLETQVARAERLSSQQNAAHQQRFDGFADAITAFVQDQVKREHAQRHENPKDAKEETDAVIYG